VHEWLNRKRRDEQQDEDTKAQAQEGEGEKNKRNRDENETFDSRRIRLSSVFLYINRTFLLMKQREQ